MFTNWKTLKLLMLMLIVGAAVGLMIPTASADCGKYSGSAYNGATGVRDDLPGCLSCYWVDCGLSCSYYCNPSCQWVGCMGCTYPGYIDQCGSSSYPGACPCGPGFNCICCSNCTNIDARCPQCGG